MDERAQRVRDLFDNAFGLPEEERTAYLRRECVHQQERAELQYLLQAADDPALSPRLRAAWTSVLDGGPAVESVRGYRLNRSIGAGAMGEVYLAELEDPTRSHRIAVKVLTRVGDHPRARERFRREVGNLAALQHDNVAKLLWVPGDDEPLYLPMEHIEGEHFGVSADRERSSIRSRISLMLRVCDGVAYFHSKGLFHLDLKPSNILVDGSGNPKVVDFGLAKLQTDDTGSQPVIASGGTSDYMSPEQLRGEPVAAETDVYALGVILYQLLTGQLPRDRSSTCSGGELTPPSLAVRRWGTEPEATARGYSSPRRLARNLEGDLDCIVLHAMDPDHSKRYGTVVEFARDLRDHLEQKPVRAHPRTLRYLAWKFVTANKVIVVPAMALIAFSLLFGAIKARDEQRVRAERDAAEAVAQYLEGLFRSADPSESRADTTTARDLLGMGVARLSELNKNQQLKARMEYTLAGVHMELGLYQQAETLLADSLALSRASGGDARSLLPAQVALARLKNRQGKYLEAENQLLQLLPILQVRGDAVLQAGAYRLLATAMMEQGRLADAEHWYRTALELGSKESPRDRAAVLNQLGLLYQKTDRFKESAESFLLALEAQRAALGPKHPDLAATLNNLGQLYFATGRLEEAEPRLSEARAIWSSTIGEEHPFFAELLMNEGLLKRAQNDPRSAETLFSQAVAIDTKRLGENHPSTAKALHNLATAYLQQKRYAEADASIERACRIYEATLGPAHPDLATAVVVAGASKLMQERYVEAEERYRRALAILEQSVGSTHTRIIPILTSLATISEERGDIPAAEEALRRASTISTAAYGPTSPRCADITERLGLLLGSNGRLREAVDSFAQALAVWESQKKQGEEFVSALLRLAAAYSALGDSSQADEFRARAIKTMHELNMSETDIQVTLADAETLVSMFRRGPKPVATGTPHR